MNDCFALLQLPRRPWIEAGVLQEHFLRLSAEMHPDRVHGDGEEARTRATERYAALNAAHQCLREPKSRLAHLLELETGARPRVVQEIPEPMMALCMEVGAVCREADQFIARHGANESPLLRVQSFSQAMEQTDAVQALLGRLNEQTAKLEEQLRELNPAWKAVDGVSSPVRTAGLPLVRLEELHRQFAYLTRWSGQLRQRVAQLAM